MKHLMWRNCLWAEPFRCVIQVHISGFHSTLPRRGDERSRGTRDPTAARVICLAPLPCGIGTPLFYPIPRPKTSRTSNFAESREHCPEQFSIIQTLEFGSATCFPMLAPNAEIVRAHTAWDIVLIRPFNHETASSQDGKTATSVLVLSYAIRHSSVTSSSGGHD